MKLFKVAAVTVVLGVACVAFQAVAGELPPASSKKDVTFATDIKPIFDNTCVGCHGPEKQKAKLRLDSLEATLKGGENGKAIEVGNSAKSPLVLSIAHVGDPDTFMPKGSKAKKAEPLTAEQVGLVRAWVDQGAK